METNKYMMPAAMGKFIKRSTGEEVEIIDSQIKERGMRSDEDWVTYIDSQGNEHIRENLNTQLDFKSNFDVIEAITKLPSFKKIPSVRNCRIFEVAKELYKHNTDIDAVINMATSFVDKIGIETE